MKTRIHHVPMLALALTLFGANMTMAGQASARANTAAHRPQGPCDVYAAAGDPCVAAHSTTRALYAAYNGPLYQVLRQSDRKTLDIGVVQPIGADAGGFANADAQDTFCANTYCWITVIYDQSGKHNNLTQPPRGGFSGPAMGGYDNIPVADMAPITIMGHKVYGVFIEPGMGLRVDDAKGTAVDDQAEGQYWVINGQHFNAGCCFDYGNAEIDSRDDGNGTMETAYYGDATAWYHGNPPGPWVMTDQENNLVGCVNPDGSKLCAELPNIPWRFVTAMAKGEPHHWTTLGGNAQQGALSVMFDGPRVNATYDPMRKQGAILLGNGGDNSNGSQGTFYEGAMTAAGTFPTDATDQLVQANIAAAKYDVQQLSIAPDSTTPTSIALLTSPGLQTFSPGSSQVTWVTFRNTTGAPAEGLTLSISAPKGWTSFVPGSTKTSVTIPYPAAPGGRISTTFKVTSGPAAFNGDLVANASWTSGGKHFTASMAEKVRNVSPIKINEFRISTSAPDNPRGADIGGPYAMNATNSFIELYNAGSRSVDLSNWTLTEHPTQQTIFSAVKIPAGTKLAAAGFYVFGISNSGLAAPARAGISTIFVRSTTGMSVGDTISIDTGAGAETRKIVSVGTAGNSYYTTLWQPLPDGPILKIPVGSTNVPVTSILPYLYVPPPVGATLSPFANTSGIKVGDKIALGYGGAYPSVAGSTERYEVATVTAVGKQGTQAYLASEALAGSTNIKVTNVANISVGDKIRLDIDSMGHGIETVTVTHVGTASGRGAQTPGTGLDLAEPLKFNHAANLPFSDRGTGISFKPATAFVHMSNEPVQALGTGITLDRPLVREHAINAVVHDAKVTTAGYQGTEPNQWFGGPALSPAAGSMVLRDAAGLVVDSLNYGLLVDPWAAEGYQAASGSGQSGCRVMAPGPGRSAGRFPDGADTDSNCTDFLTQSASTMADTAAGATNIKVASVTDFEAGQTITIDEGANSETAVIATVGTSGASTMRAATSVGATMIDVASRESFSAGQTITIDSGVNMETAVVVAAAGRRGPGSITVAAPLKNAHAAGAQVSGTGITLTTALTQAHPSGAQISGSAPPTPGAPNQYYRRHP